MTRPNHRTALLKSIGTISMFVLLVFIQSCGGDSSDGSAEGMSQGVIIYEVDYPELDPDGALVTMLPDKFTIKFKDNKIKTVFKTVAGIVEMNIIADANNYTMANVVKIFGDRYVLQMDSSSDYRVGNTMGGYTLTPSDEVVQIAMLDASRYDLSYPDASKNQTFFATAGLDIKDPNWCLVYNDIPEMLMDYSIEQYDIVMHLKASEIKYKEIDETEFTFGDDSKFLSEEEFDEVINSNLKALMSDM